MVNRYSVALGASAEEISEALEQLRVHAVTKLTTEQRFANSGIATIKVHLTGSIPLGINNRLQMQTGLHVSGADFKRRIFNIPICFKKMSICNIFLMKFCKNSIFFIYC